MMTKGEFKVCLAILEAATGKPFQQNQADVWFSLLGDLPAESLANAIKRCLLTLESNWLPPIATLRRMATEATCGVQELPEEAWAKVTQAMRQIGYPNPDKARQVLGPVIWEAIRGMGGWVALCDMDAPLTTIFAQFRDGWLRATTRATQMQALTEDVRPTVGTVSDVAKSLASQMRVVTTHKITNERKVGG